MAVEVDVDLSPAARRDLNEIVRRLTEVAGAHVARKYDTNIKQAINRLRHFPIQGRRDHTWDAARALLSCVRISSSIPPYEPATPYRCFVFWTDAATLHE
jgi:plasmid stabilization system protein ParE